MRISTYVEEGQAAQIKVAALQNNVLAANLYSLTPHRQKSDVSKDVEHSGQIKKVILFPWVLHGDAETLLEILRESIRYYVGESDELRLEKSYYTIKKVARLHVPGYQEFYKANTPNIELVKKLLEKKEHSLQF